MKVQVFEDYDSESAATAAIIGAAIAVKPNSLICIASGHTPVGVFRQLVKDVKARVIDFSKCTFVSLDEWIGIDPLDSGSCLAMLKKDFFDHLALRKDQVRYFNVTAPSLDEECDKMNNLIKNHGGLDVMLVGIGTNGHIGMNEPGTSFNTYAHIGKLAEETILTGQKYFQKPTSLNDGITLGLQHFKEAKVPILMASGETKSSIIRKVIASAPTAQIPATIIHETPQALVILDKAANGI